MAFNIKGWQRIGPIGTYGTGAGATKYKHGYVTEDDAAAVQTAGYFNSLSGQLNKGDQIDVTLDVDATPVRRDYVVTSANGAAVVVVAAQNVA